MVRKTDKFYDAIFWCMACFIMAMLIDYAVQRLHLTNRGNGPPALLSYKVEWTQQPVKLYFYKTTWICFKGGNIWLLPIQHIHNLSIDGSMANKFNVGLYRLVEPGDDLRGLLTKQCIEFRTEKFPEGEKYFERCSPPKIWK